MKSISTTYAHINIKNFDFLNDFLPLETGKFMNIQENWKILNITGSIYSKFCQTILYFFVSKVLRINFLPLSTHLSRSKTKNWIKEAIFLGTPCSFELF